MYTCSGSPERRAQALSDMLGARVSSAALDPFPGGAGLGDHGARSGFLVVDHANPRHLFGSDELASASDEGAQSFFYFLGQA
jgi:hypothetical protein